MRWESREDGEEVGGLYTGYSKQVCGSRIADLLEVRECVDETVATNC